MAADCEAKQSWASGDVNGIHDTSRDRRDEFSYLNTGTPLRPLVDIVAFWTPMSILSMALQSWTTKALGGYLIFEYLDLSCTEAHPERKA